PVSAGPGLGLVPATADLTPAGAVSAQSRTERSRTDPAVSRPAFAGPGRSLPPAQHAGGGGAFVRGAGPPGTRRPLRRLRCGRSDFLRAVERDPAGPGLGDRVLLAASTRGRIRLEPRRRRTLPGEESHDVAAGGGLRLDGSGDHRLAEG